MPTKRFLEIQKLYTTLGLTALSRTEVTFLVKRLEAAETILERVYKQGYVEQSDLREVGLYQKAGEV